MNGSISIMEGDVDLKAKPLLRTPGIYFKPYYEMRPWSEDGRFFICMRTKFQDRPPTPDDTLELGVADVTSGEFLPVAETRAWNFQQGCMPHWLPEAANRKIIYNDRFGQDCRAVAVDIVTGEKREFPRPIQAVCDCRNLAAGLNFGRWGDWRPGYGYAGVKDPFEGEACPSGDTVYLMDMGSGEVKDLVSLPEVAALTSDNDARRGAPMWFCHLMFNPSGTRLVGLVRWWAPDAVGDVYRTEVNIDKAVPERRHCMWTVDLRTGKLEIVINDALVSHASWYDDDTIVYWGNTRIDEAPAYTMIDLRDGRVEILGRDCLTCDGHMSFHKNKRYMLTDTYPDGDYLRDLKIFDLETGAESLVGRFYAPPELTGELRCDLHPCWNRDFTKIAIDSIHDRGMRNVYVIDFDENNLGRKGKIYRNV